MNHAFFIVKVVKSPIHLMFKDYETIEIKVEFPTSRQKNSKNEILLLLWGDHRDDFLKYYKVQDYLLIEGIITLNATNTNKEVKVTVKKLYPFLLL
uniref:Ycf41 n=1 Tax=Coccophora langsdorfii TaxID=74099 RepID=A0A1L2F1K3_9PHAE|nr:Ycf41 [Coccophora langsdorfii]ANS72220.1 Ycf41 [Coccophora langsdorfii]